MSNFSCFRCLSTKSLFYSLLVCFLFSNFTLIILNDKVLRGSHQETITFHQDSSRTCTIPNDWLYPFCAEKVKWMRSLWDINKECYVETHGLNPVDDCSILIYLSEVESRCPIFPWRKSILAKPKKYQRKAMLRWDLNGAMNLLTTSSDKYRWMKNRIRKLWPQWMSGLVSLVNQKKLFGIRHTHAKKVLIYLGTFAFYPKLFEYAFYGGPLGELVQWSDLITSLYILGHNITITSNETEIPRLLKTPNKPGGCAMKYKVAPYDVIYTDLNGAHSIMTKTGPNFPKFLCLLRILDSFGTEAEFNFSGYKGTIPGGKSPWGGMDFNNLRQLMTMFPHSPDNLFLGFVVDTTLLKRDTRKKKLMGLVYGKLDGYYKGKESYLKTLQKYIEIHGTASKTESTEVIPDFVQNHGVVNYAKLEELLNDAKVFIGLGFPYEGPAPLEAIAHGCVFLNPKLDPPHDRLNTDFFKAKPTLRKLGSQHPYADKFIGKPYVWTVDINNKTEVEETIKNIMKAKVEPYLSYEWTTAGMLERVNAFTEKLNFCEHKHRWPPLSERRVYFGNIRESCKDVCEKRGYLCEPSYFYEINNVKLLESLGAKCLSQETQEALNAPSYSPSEKSCTLQAQPLLFSCVSSDPKRMRLCPCRDYQVQQVAFCRNCG